MERQHIVNYWDFTSNISRNCHKKVGTENYSTLLMRKVCKSVSPQLTDLSCIFCWNDSVRTPFPATSLPYTYSSLPPSAPFTQLFSQSLSPHTPCSCLDILSTTNNLCNFWHSKIQEVSTYAFRSWDDIFTQKWNCSSPNNLCQCTESPSTLSTNTSILWNLYLS